VGLIYELIIYMFRRVQTTTQTQWLLNRNRDNLLAINKTLVQHEFVLSSTWSHVQMTLFKYVTVCHCIQYVSTLVTVNSKCQFHE